MNNQQQQQLDVNNLLEVYREEILRLSNDLIVAKAIIKQQAKELDAVHGAMKASAEDGTSQDV